MGSDDEENGDPALPKGTRLTTLVPGIMNPISVLFQMFSRIRFGVHK